MIEDSKDKRMVGDPNQSLYQDVQEDNAFGAVTASYTFGLSRLAAWNGSAVTFELDDRLSSVRIVADGSGNIIQTFNYDAFGANR